MERRERVKLWVFGVLGGLVLGLSYWYAWGCRACAKDNSAVALVAFCAVLGGVMARLWGPDHRRAPS